MKALCNSTTIKFRQRKTQKTKQKQCGLENQSLIRPNSEQLMPSKSNASLSKNVIFQQNFTFNKLGIIPLKCTFKHKDWGYSNSQFFRPTLKKLTFSLLITTPKKKEQRFHIPMEKINRTEIAQLKTFENHGHTVHSVCQRQRTKKLRRTEREKEGSYLIGEMNEEKREGKVF